MSALTTLALGACLAFPASAQELTLLTDCESLDHWHGVTLIDQAKEGQHAVRYSVPAGKPAGPSFDHGHVKVNWAGGGELRFWYRLSGTGRSTLMIKLLAYPFADGWQATWWVSREQQAEGQWRLATVDLSSPYMRWGEKPDLQSQYLQFRTQATADAKLTLDLDDVRLVPRLFQATVVSTRVGGDHGETELQLQNATQAALTVELASAEVQARVALPGGATVTQRLRFPLSADWLREAPPLSQTTHALSVGVSNRPYSRKELMVTLVKPLPLPPHPRLLLTADELPALREKARSVEWAKAFYAQQVSAADGWLKQKIVLPPRGGQWWHWYACKQDGARLKTLSPTQHQCPVCKQIYSGWPYDDVVLDRQHNRLANGLRSLGLVYQLTGDARYASKAREILLAYADRYTKYPLHNIHGKPAVGGGRVGPQTLDESTWLIPMCQGADLIWDTLTPEDRKRAEEGLFRPAAEVIRQHRMSIHNIQCWKNSAVGLTGLLLGDDELIWDAVKSPHGFEAQIARGVSADGQWYEGAWGYHFYTMSALWGLAEAGQRCGLDLYGYESEGRSYRRLFEGPLDLAMPDLRLPAFNDSGTANIRSAARFYECALAHYGEPRLAVALRGSDRRSLEAFINGVEPLPDPGQQAGGSRNFPAAGYAVLQHGENAEAAWLCLKYGPHGGGHGHPDKLNFVSYAKGQILGYDPGTAAYGVPIQQEWYRTTLAHNTLVVDAQNQRPAEGHCLAFLAEPERSAVLADAGESYPGVTYRRAVALFGQSLILVLDLVSADEEHVYDLAYHNAGRWRTAPTGKPVTLPADLGYRHLRDLVATTEGLPAIEVTDGLSVQLATASTTPVQVLAGTGVGRNTTDRVPCVIARVQGKQATVAWALAVAGQPPAVKLTGDRTSFVVEARHGPQTCRMRVAPEATTKLVMEVE